MHQYRLKYLDRVKIPRGRGATRPVEKEHRFEAPNDRKANEEVTNFLAQRKGAMKLGLFRLLE